MLQLDQVLRRQHLADLDRFADHPLDDSNLLARGRIADHDLEHETVDLRFRQRVGAIGLDRVLGGEDQERLIDPERLLGDGDLSLLHHLEQRRLNLGGGPVDLVREKKVAEDRAQLGRKVSLARVEHPGSDQV